MQLLRFATAETEETSLIVNLYDTQLSFCKNGNNTLVLYTHMVKTYLQLKLSAEIHCFLIY